MFCSKCGCELKENADVCLNCGALVKDKTQHVNNDIEPARTGWVLAIICFFLGSLGIHRFMVGKTGTGILWLLTFGLLGIGTLIDFIMILCSSFTDIDGNRIQLIPNK